MSASTDATPAQRALEAGVAQGLLPPGAALPAHESRPWPVVLLTALGAWLAAIPLIGVVGLLMGDLISRSVGPYFVGVLLLAAAITVLRSRELPVFVEQLAVPALLVGGGALAFGLFRDLPDRLAAGALGVVALGAAHALHHPWLRTLLGACAAGLCMAMLMPGKGLYRDAGATLPAWLAIHGTLLLLLAVGWAQHRVLNDGGRARLAASVESIGGGWLLAVLAALALWSGMSFMIAGSMEPWSSVANELGTGRPLGLDRPFVQACSVALGAAALLATGRSWLVLRSLSGVAVGLVLTGLCWFLPALGAALLLLALTATSQRWRLAGAAAVAAAWIVGSFYYQLQWPLADKALVLSAAGAALAAIAWLARPPADAAPATVAVTPHRYTAALMALAALLTLGAANFAIWQKERLIAQGDKVFVALAPVDPRSLMQGDYMRLNYNVPATADDTRRRPWAQRPCAIAKRDARGVAQLLRVAPAEAPLADGEMRIELTPKDGRWILVSDAWFFREGDGMRWQAAKYGEFRVTPDGKALLVGLADAQLRTIPVRP